MSEIEIHFSKKSFKNFFDFIGGNFAARILRLTVDTPFPGTGRQVVFPEQNV
jgi:hypothetical protein